MATVILSEGNSFLSESGNYTPNFLCANRAQKPVMLSGGFFEEFFDDLGDLGNSFMDLFGNIVDASGNIIQGAGQGVGGYLTNPNNIAQVGGVIATGLTGMPVNLTPQQQQQWIQTQQMNQQQNSFSALLRDPIFLIAGAALIYFVAKK
jgi:hypothetical protein